MFKFITTHHLTSFVVAAGISAFSVQSAAAETILQLINTSTEEVIEISEEQFMEFEQHSVVTGNEFVDGEVEFEGPLARDVVALFEIDAEEYVFTAVNDYAVPIPAEDIMEYDVILAVSQDGVPFSRRTKGPIWVIYPMTDHEELQDRTYNDRLIWQVASVTVE